MLWRSIYICDIQSIIFLDVFFEYFLNVAFSEVFFIDAVAWNEVYWFEKEGHSQAEAAYEE